MNPNEIAGWSIDWAWGFPLIVLSVVIHVIGLGLINERAAHVLNRPIKSRRFLFMFATVMGIAAMLATALHGVEGAAWAIAYRLLGALSDDRSAMLYSLGAMTTYGHAGVYLEHRWELMGTLEALNGMLLFGLTTAFLFAMIQQVWSPGQRGRHRDS